ncbi:MAG: response regulator [Planctomycetes bacterium]|nr:response regulator [Planctomycetota bacterium]
MAEVILLEPDPETRLLLRSLLERDGYEVNEADSPRQAADIVRGSRAQALIMTARTRASCEQFVAELERTRPDLDVLAPPSFGAALLDGSAQRDSVAEFSRDALLLLAVLAEEATKYPPAAEKLGRLSELTALRLGLSRLQVEACSAAAALVALGPTLVAFRFGVPEEAASTMASQAPDAAEGGLGKDLQAAMAAAAALRCPYDLRGILEAIEERFDGRGRPRGLKGVQIPIAARVVAVAREYSMLVAEGQEEVVATELVRSRAGSDYDPKVVDAFFRALRDESYVTRLEAGKRGARVLYVDPDAAACAVAELRLDAAGFSVQVCDDGQRAHEAILAEPPDVIISETVLPRVDGISLLLKLRREPATQHVPLIFVSARTDAGLLNKALKLGAKDVIAKPVNFDVLIAKLRTLASGAMAAAQKSGAASGGVQGDLAEMPLTDFFQVLSLGRKTVKVVVSSPSGQGQIFFERGAPVAAYTPKARGMDAFAQILEWTQGSFSLVSGEIAPERNLDPSFQNMLMQMAAAPPGSGGHGSAHGSAHGEAIQGPGVMFAPAAPAPATLVDDDDPYGAAPGGAKKDIEFDFGGGGENPFG